MRTENGDGMEIERNSVSFRILEELCAIPPPVRGISAVMLNRKFSAPQAVAELEQEGLIAERRWDKGSGGVLVPTEAGKRLYTALAGETIR